MGGTPPVYTHMNAHPVRRSGLEKFPPLSLVLFRAWPDSDSIITRFTDFGAGFQDTDDKADQ